MLNPDHINISSELSFSHAQGIGVCSVDLRMVWLWMAGSPERRERDTDSGGGGA